jgi:hypothetical protein
MLGDIEEKLQFVCLYVNHATHHRPKPSQANAMQEECVPAVRQIKLLWHALRKSA